MTDSLQADVTEAVRGVVPFFVITVLWSVVMLAMYGLFLATKPNDLSYGPIVHGSVFLPPLVGFAGHALQYALKNAGRG